MTNQQIDPEQQRNGLQERRGAFQDRRQDTPDRRQAVTDGPTDKEQRIAPDRRQNMSDRRQSPDRQEAAGNAETPPEKPVEEKPTTATGKDGKQWPLNPHKVIVKLTDGSQISGTINVIGNHRLSDMFTKSPNPFIVVYNAGMQGRTDRVVVINKHQIVFIAPDD